MRVKASSVFPVVLVAALAAVAVVDGAALALTGATALILPTHTPGARYSKVTQKTIKTTICRKGWTARVRPPSSYTSKLKKAQLRAWHYVDRNPRHYVEDHLISLELGGAPFSKKNLWPEPLAQARRADRHENAWRQKLCNRAATLRQVQRAELAYKRAYG
jgi:hypothetical protein